MTAASPQRPRIVCLCGSTRFYDAYVEANYQETLAGHIVLSCGVFGMSIHKERYQSGEALALEKIPLDELHRRKIDLADEILVINVAGYIGESTASEIEYAIQQGKSVRYWQPPLPPNEIERRRPGYESGYYF